MNDDQGGPVPGQWPAPSSPSGGVSNPLSGGEPPGPTIPVDQAAEPDRPQRHWALVAGVAAAAVLLVVAAIVFAVRAGSEQAGAETPDAAVEQMVEAISNEDFIALAELLDPGERDSFARPIIDDMVPELSRIGVFSADLDLADFRGLDIDLTAVDFEIRPTAHDDLVLAVPVGGTVSASIEPSELPLGQPLSDEMEDTEPMSETGSVDASTGSDDVAVAFVERDGRWFMSMWHTIGESARMATGAALPDPGAVPTPAGADSPEAAVSQLIDAIVDLDAEAALTSLDPEEASALYRYAPDFLDDLSELGDDALDAAAEAGVSWDVTDLEFEVDRDGDEARVRIVAGLAEVDWEQGRVAFSWSPDGFEVTVAAEIDGDRLDLTLSASNTQIDLAVEITDRNGAVLGDLTGDFDIEAGRGTLSGELDGERFEGELQFDPDGDCSEYSVTGPDIDESGCLETELDSPDIGTQFFESLEQWSDTEWEPAVTITATEVDGEWFVSPTRTLIAGMVSALNQVPDDGIEEFIESLDSTAGSSAGDDILGDLIDEAMGDSEPPGPSAAPLEPVAELSVGPGEEGTVPVRVGDQAQLVLLAAPPGSEVSIGVGGDVDPVLEVVADRVYSNDDYSSQTGLASGLRFTMPESGVAELWISEYSQQAGEAVVRVAVAEPGGVAPDPGELIANTLT